MNIIEVSKAVLESFAVDRDLYLVNSVLADGAKDRLVAVLKLERAPTYDVYKSWRTAFLKNLPESITSDAAAKRWERLVKDAGMTIPKAGTATAKAMSVTRQKEKEALAELSDSALADTIKKLESADPLGKAVKVYVQERNRRASEAVKPVIEARKATKAAIREKLKDCEDDALLRKIAALLEV